MRTNHFVKFFKKISIYNFFYCRQSRRKVSAVDFDKCKARLTKCSKQQLKCSRDIDPICGSDANTYPNQCHLNVAICM